MPVTPFSSSKFHCLAMLLIAFVMLLTVSPASAEKHQTAQTPVEDSQPTDEANLSNQPTTPSRAEGQIEDSMANIEVIQQTLETLRNEIESSKETTSLNRDNVKTIRDGVKLIEDKLKETYADLDESRTGVAANTASIAKLTENLLSSTRDIKANAADLGSQKSLIEDNSIRLYEILIQISSMNDKVGQFGKALDHAKNADNKQHLPVAISSELNRLWRSLIIVLVFLTPLAFVMSINSKQGNDASLKAQQQNLLLACFGAFLSYFLVGFGLMYGDSSAGLIGTSDYLLAPSTSDKPTHTPLNQFILYQSGFAILAAMIVTLAIGKRLSGVSHFFLALFIGALLIPVFGHWTWASSFIPGNKGWLEGIGFVDQAGAITINAVAAWFMFTVAWQLGKSPYPPQKITEKPDDTAYSSGAILLLWVSWLGFTTGTLPIANTQISAVMLNVGLAATAGGAIAFLHYAFFHTDAHSIARTSGGFVSGLVAIAACAHSVTAIEALVIGAIAGFLQNIAYRFLRKTFLRQHWQARPAALVAIHGFAAIWGALSVALFSSENTFGTPNFMQLTVQVQGIASVLLYSLVMGHLAMLLLAFRKKKTTGS